MTTAEKKVAEIAKEIYKMGFAQITIDFVQEEVEDLLNPDPGEEVTRDAAGALAYRCDLLQEVMDPKRFRKDIDLLNRLRGALNAWSADIEATNIALGLPKEGA